MTTAVSPSTETIAKRVRDAASRGAPLRITGAGTWLDAGRPVESSEQLSLAAHTGISEYTPGDLTLTAKAGTTLGEIRDAVSPHGQWLALDPCGSDEGTIGATIATASSGPLATRFGAPRDLALGLEFVNGLGAAVRGGGRVVKNVAGFDLTRLLTGCWGTLGVITEVTVRLHARPEADVTLVVSSNEGQIDIGAVRSAVGRWPFVPLACEVVNGTLGRQIGVGGPAVLFRIGGNGESVVAQRRAIAELGEPREMESNVWGALRTADADASLVLRLSRAPADVGSTWADAIAIAAPYADARVSVSPARGIVRCAIPLAAASIEQAATTLAGVQSRVIAERAPAKLWKLPPLARPADPLRSRIRDAFDPRHILNHGILGSVS
jgi:glycolate dehydrogenase FAD-binding subunit